MSSQGMQQTSAGRWRLVVLGFVLRFAVIFSLCYGAYTLFWDSAGMRLYLEWIARASELLLGWFFEGMRRSEATIWNSAFTAEVDHGCDALLPSACFLSATLAFPAPIGKRMLGALFGMALLQLLNLVRIAALFAVGVHAPDRFDFAHQSAGEALFMLAVICTWIAWASWALRRRAAGAADPL